MGKQKFEKGGGIFDKGVSTLGTNSPPNADISKKNENRFFLIKLKIFYIWALNFPHLY